MDFDTDNDNATTRRQVLKPVRELRGREDLEAWDLEITGKLLVDGHAIGDARACLFYIWGALSRDLQQTTFLPYMRKAITRPDPDAFLTYIRTTLEEPNKVWKAGQRLTKLRQNNNQAISAYIPIFEGVLFQAGGDEWADRAKIVLLITGLNPTTSGRLDQEAWPETWEAFLQLLRGLETSFASPHQLESRSRSSTTLSPDDPMDIGTVMLRQRARQKNKCFKCGATGHYARNCPPEAQSRGEAQISTLSLQDRKRAAATAYQDAYAALEDLDAFAELVELDEDDY